MFPLRIYTALKRKVYVLQVELVCFPYEFTLLSNIRTFIYRSKRFVSPTNLHCSQTCYCKCGRNCKVCFPYEFTLLSNRLLYIHQHYCSLFPLRIYTALKQSNRLILFPHSLFPLRIYTALKLTGELIYLLTVCFPYEFTLLSNERVTPIFVEKFVSPTNLHCSQTRD